MTLLHRLWMVVLGIAVLFALSNVWMPRLVGHHTHAITMPTAARTTSVLDSRTPALPARSDDWADPRVDLNGNEVDDAVNDYRVDGRGEMYERHAPDTALLHLSAPEL
jgi:hypothetical protein